MGEGRARAPVWVLPCSRKGRRSSLQSLYLHMGGTVIRTAFAYLSAVHLLQLPSNKHDVQKPCVVHRHVDFDCFFIHCRVRSHLLKSRSPAAGHEACLAR